MNQTETPGAMNEDRYAIEDMVLLDSKRPIGIIIADEVDKEILTEMAFTANRAEKLEAALREFFAMSDNGSMEEEDAAFNRLRELIEPQPTESQETKACAKN